MTTPTKTRAELLTAASRLSASERHELVYQLCETIQNESDRLGDAMSPVLDALEVCHAAVNAVVGIDNAHRERLADAEISAASIAYDREAA